MKTAALVAAVALSMTIARAQTSDTAGIMAAVIADLYLNKPPANVVVEETPLAFAPPSTDDWQSLGGDTAALQKKIAGATTVATLYTQDELPKGTTLVARQVILDAFHWEPGTDLNARWATFRETFKAPSWERFSRPVITDDGLDALVTYGHGCGPLCGEGGYAWLHRVSRSAPWVVKRLVKIVS